MSGALLVAHKNVLDLILLIELIVNRQHSAAGIAENVLDAMVDQRLHDHFRPGHLARSARPFWRRLVFCLGLCRGVHLAFSVDFGARAGFSEA